MNKAKIHYHDIGDYLSREAKLGILRDFGGIDSPTLRWQILRPNEHGDWINKRDERFGEFIPLAPEKKYDAKTKGIFVINSNGVVTARDAWAYNFSENAVTRNMNRMIQNYNSDVDRVEANSSQIEVEDIITKDEREIKWGQNLIRDAKNLIRHTFQNSNLVYGLYRPFVKQSLYFSKSFNWSRYLQPSLFPDRFSSNYCIIVSGVGASKGFSALMSEIIPNLDTLEKAQCFPLYWYDDSTKDISDLFSTPDKEMDKYIRRDGVSDYILKLCREKYGNKSDITKEDIFYYVYGILHSPTYRETFAADLKKMLPRLPLVDSVDDFRAFSDAGRALADLHLNYESVTPYKGAIVTYGANNRVDYRVDKMRFGKSGKVEDKTTILYNNQITISNIPLEAYDYIVNGKSAIEWVMERYAVTTHKESGIRNDPNDWAAEHGNEKYILNLLLSLITVSLETNKIVAGLPKLNFE